MKYYILYNPLAGHGNQEEKNSALKAHLDGECVECDVTKIKDYNEFIASLQPDDKIVISGGDGTLNRFVNTVDTDNISIDILYYACGTGNDFLKDVGKEPGCGPFKINKYLKNLPTVTIDGKSYRFINGIGFGIDGYCCEEGDKIRAKGKKDVNYTAIAIKGMIYDFKPRNAHVVVDGQEFDLKKAWIAPTMFGRFYGGGIMPAPNQDRLGDGRVSFAAFHSSGKLKTLMIFPQLFKGTHLKYTKYIKIVEATDVSVTFDRPCPLQVDGETFLNVTNYTVHANVKK